MPSVVFEQIGYLLWEGSVLACVVVGTLAFVVLRRRINGKRRPLKQDWKSLFNTSPAPVSKPRFCLRFVLAVFLFSGIGFFEVIAFAHLGAAILSVSLLVSCAGIVNTLLL